MLPRSHSHPGAIAALVVLLFTATVRADDWPQWLGPTRDGQWREKDLLETFPKDGPKQVWKVPVGTGYSGPAVAGGKVYITDRVTAKIDADKPPPKGELPGNERVRCLDAKTGAEIWAHVYDCTYKKVSYPLGPRTTPVIDGDRIFALGTMGDLICLDMAGKVVWQKSFSKDLAAPTPVWGWSAHLLVDGDKLIALVGGEGRAVMAFDKKTGAEKWKALSTADVGYSPPVIAQLGGKRQLIAWLSDKVAGLDPETGTAYWTEPHPAKGKKQMTPSVTITTPRVVGDRVYISSAYDGMLALQFAEGNPVPKIAWRAEDIFPKSPEKLPTLMSSILARGDHLYGVEAGTGKVQCLEAVSGKQVWQDAGLFKGKDALFGTAFWVEAGDKVYALSDEGDLVVLALSPKGYTELARAHVIEATHAARGRKVVWAHPAFADKCLFARNDHEMVCISLAK